MSLTPLIDVVFILLLFFMLASSFEDLQAITLDSPAASPGGSGLQGALLVDVTREGLRYAGAPADRDTVIQRVRIALADDPQRRVLVRPAGGVDLQATVDVLDALDQAGVQRLSLMEGALGRGRD